MALREDALHKWYKHERRRYERASMNLLTGVQSLLDDFGPDRGIRPVASIEQDVKEFDSFYKKARDWERQGRVRTVEDCFEKINDIARARIVCQTVDDVELIVRLFEEQDRLYYRGKVESHPAPGKDSTGYRAIHIDLDIDAQVEGSMVATPCELQVMTALQYAWGLYTHPMYKDKARDVSPLVATLMRELSDLLNVADRIACQLLMETEGSSPPS
jgi:putative GTP pyrophosphokinase